MQRRIKWARRQVTWNKHKWAVFVLSGEKHFNLDGPDGFIYYWHDIRKSKAMLYCCQTGGGGIMVWGAFSLCGKSELAVLTGRQNTECSLKVTEDFLLPLAHKDLHISWIYQPGNAPIHVSFAAGNWFSSQGYVLWSGQHAPWTLTIWRTFGDGHPALPMPTTATFAALQTATTACPPSGVEFPNSSSIN